LRKLDGEGEAAFRPGAWALTFQGDVVSAVEILDRAKAEGQWRVRFQDGCVHVVKTALMRPTTIAFSGLSDAELLDHTKDVPCTSAAEKRLEREWRGLRSGDFKGTSTIALGPLSSGMRHWHARIQGPKGTPYEDRNFYIDIQIPAEYPGRPPVFRFITPIYHTAAHAGDGFRVQAPELAAAWSPAFTLVTALTVVQVLLSTVQPELAADGDAYQAMAKEWAERYGQVVGGIATPGGSSTSVVPLTRVHVTSLTSVTRTIPVNMTTTLGDLRQAIHDRTGAPVDVIVLALNGRLLSNDAATLFDLGVQHDDTLQTTLARLALARSAVINAIERAVEIKYDGKVRPDHGIPCIVSFPGKYGAGWDKVVSAGSGVAGDVSVACVFLPKLTPKYGKHAANPSTGTCFCHEMYGEQKEWGCEWVRAWQENVEEAVSWGQKLRVYYFAGMAGLGKVSSWEECGRSNLRSEQLWAKQGPFLAALPAAEKQRLEGLSNAKRYDSSTERSEEERRLFLQSLPSEDRAHLLAQEGLGWSQKAEVAWLEKRFRETGNAAYLYEEVDVKAFLDA